MTRSHWQPPTWGFESSRSSEGKKIDNEDILREEITWAVKNDGTEALAMDGEETGTAERYIEYQLSCWYRYHQFDCHVGESVARLLIGVYREAEQALIKEP